VDAKDQATATWVKLCVSDFLANFFQVALIWMAMTAAVAVPLSGLAKGLFFIGCAFAIMNGPSGIAQLLGSNIGAANSFQQMQQLFAFKSALQPAFQAAGSAVSFAAAAGVYGTGRALGGRTLNTE